MAQSLHVTHPVVFFLIIANSAEPTELPETSEPEVVYGSCHVRMTTCYFPIEDRHRYGLSGSLFIESCFSR